MKKDKIIEQKPNILVGITHNGKFHCDDVCCAALLRIIYPDIQIVRQSTINCDPDNIKNTIVFDIGEGKYDHHNNKPEYRSNGVQYSSFGKIYRDFAKYIPMSKSTEVYLDENFVQEIDKMDTNVGFSLFGLALGSFNVPWDDDMNKQDERFFEAVDIAQKVLVNIIEKRAANSRADQYIDKAIETQNSPILLLDKSMPIHNRLESHIMLIISPSDRESYNLQPVKGIDGKWRKCLPNNEWKENPPEGLIFNNGAVAVFDTVYNAINAAEMVLKHKDIEKFPIHIIKAVQSNKFKIFKSKDSSEQITIDGFDILSNNKICAFREEASFYTLNPLEIDTNGKVYINAEITYGIVDNRDKSDYIITAKEFNKNSKEIKITQRSLPNGNRFDIA